jgi:prophage DNA circulation protein
MSWREDLGRVALPDGRRLIGASFRGVPFLVTSSARIGGRRVVVHEFPLRPDPFVEDLDKRAAKFKLQGYVIGDDYLTQRDKLRVALEESSGPGELRHPSYGVVRAVCESLEISEASDQGGMATFAIDFAEAPLQAPVPVQVADSSSKVSSSADAARSASMAQLAATFRAAGLPGFALATSSAAIASAADALSTRLGPVIAEAQELAELNSALTLLVAQTSSLLTTPGSIVDAFADAIESLETTAASAPSALLDALIDAYGVDLGSVPASNTSTRARESANLAALTGAIRQVLALEAARVAPGVPYATQDDATAARDTIAGILQDQALLAGDIAFPGLVDLRSELMLAVPGGNNFPRVVTTRRRSSIPSLVLAHQLYGSVELEADIIARNRIVNPAFVFGDLQVLSNGA